VLTPSDIESAYKRIREHTEVTPLIASGPMSERSGSQVFIKTEHRQRTGSFKIRGALNAILGLDDSTASLGVVTASSGNHGIAVATAADIRNIGCVVYLPNGASESKVAGIRRLGAEIVFVDSTDAVKAESAARAEARASGRYYLSPYNDLTVVAGQGTVGIEVLAQASAHGIESVDVIVVSVGGGGLISGLSTWLAEHSPTTRIVGASPANDMAMAASVAAGTIVDVAASPTISDGTAGGLESDAVTFPICERLVTEWITPSEAQIAAAVATMIDDHHELVEGAAGVALAAGAQYAEQNPASSVIVVSCGANISASATQAVLQAAARH